MRCLRLIVAISTLLGGCVLSGDDIPPPQISAIVPPRATAGTTITIEGDHFCPTPDTGSDTPPACGVAGGILTMGGSSAMTSSWSGIAIDAVVPSLAPGTVDVIVTVGGRPSNTAQFEVAPSFDARAR